MKLSHLHRANCLFAPLITLSILCSLVACSNSEFVDKDAVSEITDPQDEVSVTLPLSVTELNLPTTRSMSSEIENGIDISKAIVLLFKTESGSETFFASVPSTKYKLETTNNATTLKFKMQPSAGSETYRIVVIMNYGTLQSNVTPKQGDDMATVLSKYNIIISSTGWNNSTYIPLCGKTDSRIVEKDVTFKDESGSDKIQLIRSLARIDVGVNFEAADISNNNAAGLSNFILNSAILTGFPNQTFIARWNDPNTPSVPATLQFWAAASYNLQYKASWDKTVHPHAVLGCFYMGEANAETTISSNSACLIAGGFYGGSSIETFYRIELASNDGVPFAKLRNHLYRVNITEVRGPGLSSAAEAVAHKGMSTNAYLNAAIVSWDASSAAVTEIGNKWLSVNFTNLTVGNTAKTYSPSSASLTIKTNCNSWTVTSTDTTWLTTDRTDGTFSVTANTTGASRSAQLKITSTEGLKLTVNIYQTA